MNRSSWLIVEGDEGEFILFRRACAARLQPIPALHWATSAAAAQDVLSQLAQGPELIVSDLRMPGMSRFDLLQWLRTDVRFRTVRFVMFTNSSDPKNIADARSLGADYYRVKPVDMADLDQLVADIAAGIPDRLFCSGKASH
jgi:CheY-like chemotaxis protein